MTKKKHYIKTVDDIKYCEENGKMLFDKDNKYSFKFDNGRWTEYDVEGNLCSYNTTLFVSDDLHYYEEESEEQTEVSEKDIGKLCWFWDVDNNKFIEVLAGYDKDSKTPYECGAGWYNRYYRPLTKEEIQEFMEKA